MMRCFCATNIFRTPLRRRLRCPRDFEGLADVACRSSSLYSRSSVVGGFRRLSFWGGGGEERSSRLPRISRTVFGQISGGTCRRSPWARFAGSPSMMTTTTSTEATAASAVAKLTYPRPRQDEASVETHFGIEVADPYRWMEDPGSEETKAFVEAQNAVSTPYLKGYEKAALMEQRLTELWNYPKFGVPSREGARYFFYKNDGLQNQHVLYVQETLDSEPRVFFDPNASSEDGTVSLATNAFSKDGSLWAYGLSHSGSDWFDIHVKNVETGENYPEVLERAKFCEISWTHDNKGFFYGCYTEANKKGLDIAESKGMKMLYHRLGQSQAEDVTVVEFPDHPDWMIRQNVSDCGKYLIVSTRNRCRDNLVFYVDLEEAGGNLAGKLDLTQMVYKMESDFEYVTNEGTAMVFRTNYEAPNYRLVTIDLERDRPPDLAAAAREGRPWPMRDLVPEHGQNVLEWACCVAGDNLVCCYMSDVKNVVDVVELGTGAFKFRLPLEIGAVDGFSGHKDHAEFFFKFSSIIVPGVIYCVDMAAADKTPKVLRKTEIAGHDPDQLRLEQVFYESKDGTRVPMFIAARKDQPRDGTSPCLLYGYGGFNVSITPSFSVTQLFFIKHFGFLAVPNIRGGGEYGETWHSAGRLFNKQNGFDDFQAAAEFLVRERYTCPAKLAIKGGSNGGLLVGACCNQRPDLFGAGVAAVGVMDMLRFHKFTIGYAWCSDYGDPDEEDHFRYLLTYSPLHNVRVPPEGVQYPAMLLITADHDDRVVPSHTLKYIAQLQAVIGSHPEQTKPLMARIDTKAGHGHGKPTSKCIEELTDTLSFLARTLDYEFKED